MSKNTLKIKCRKILDSTNAFITRVKSCVKKIVALFLPHIDKAKKILTEGCKKAVRNQKAFAVLRQHCAKMICKAKAHPRAWAVATAAGLWIVVLLVAPSKEAPPTEPVPALGSSMLEDTVDRLNTLQVDLTSLFDALDAQLLAQEKLALNIDRLHDEVETMKQATDDLDSDVLWREVMALMEDVEALKAPGKVLPGTELPFEVLGLDFWNGVPLASVKAGVHTDLMGLGEVRSGWRLHDLNMQAETLVFENKHHERVKISLSP